MSGYKVCLFFVAMFVLAKSFPAPDIFIDPKNTEHEEIGPIVNPTSKDHEEVRPFVTPVHKDIEEVAPATIPDNKENEMKKGIVFMNPPSLCMEAVENVDKNCVNHCKNKGYSIGLCFETKCTCN